MTKQKSKFLKTDKKSLIVGSIVATLIAITPYLFYLYESVPDTPVWNTFLFTYTSYNYQSANVAMWILTSKAIPLLLLLIWFFTCRHWWYHVLLVPISMYIFQVFGLINGDSRYLDEFQLIYMIPVMAVIIPSIYLVKARIFNQINEASKSMEELEEEFKMSPKNFWQRIKQYF
ncbi:hypothetical protein ACFSKN_02385 [Mariniflexile gromovii]|uniref:hypothetical protein n=1 Tax=Mariniflexile gromovii TaxID=362523 RepID=UPI001FD81532|nr:hypothetical protein [Mariniflexile gromovii]